MLERFEISLNWEEIKTALVDRVTRQFSDNAEVVITRVLDTVLASVQSFIAVVAALVLIFFVVFYLLVEWSSLFARASEFLPPRHRTTAAALAKECDQLLSQYLRGQLSVMLVLAAYYAIALSLSGMAGAVGIGILTGLAIFIPYIGFGVGLALALISGLLQFGPGAELLIIGLIYAAGQLLESFVLTPTLVGQKIGLHPVAVVFALMFFGSLFGFFGVLLALPAAAITLVGLRFMRQQIEDSRWFSGQ
jgi:predicted PurR-regulated permease PerM